jgi:soluble lytic murein transglycosylase-like protein
VQARRKKDGTIVITNLEPRPSSPKEIPPDLKPILTEAAWHYGLPVPLIGALIRAESNFNPLAVSPKGAMGLMQLMPGTASDLGVRDPYNPRENVLAGCRYFRVLLNRFQSLPLALAAYNAGSQRVVNAGHRVPGIRETQEFVTSVLENYCLADQEGFAGVRRVADRSVNFLTAKPRGQTARSLARGVVPPPSREALQPAPRPRLASFLAAERPSQSHSQTAAAILALRPGALSEPRGKVTRRQDGRGVWRITNIPPAREAAPPQVGAGREEEFTLQERLPQARVLLASGQDARRLAREEHGADSIRKSPDLSSQVRRRREKSGTHVITNLSPLKSSPDEILKDLKPTLMEAAWHYALPTPLIRALIKVESNFNPLAVSPKGAMGLMQLMPGTISDLEVRDPYCPRENVLAGGRRFHSLLDRFNQALPLALAAYNAGSQRVVNAGCRVPGVKETQEFVTSVLENCSDNQSRGF